MTKDAIVAVGLGLFTWLLMAALNVEGTDATWAPICATVVSFGADSWRHRDRSWRKSVT